jgi:hypothetical protein
VSTNITIHVEGERGGSGGDPKGDLAQLSHRVDQLAAQQQELLSQMGDQISPFPDAGIDGFLSHFILLLQFLNSDLNGRSISLRMPPAVQTVSRSAPFIYRQSGSPSVKIPLPKSCTLPDTIAESDFIEKPDGYFEDGRETVWMQILNLDARMDVPELGPIRIILGETLKREYPDLFEPSLGVAQALGRRGFPSKLFFNPYALIETPMGAFRAIHGTLSYGRVTAFPPVGTPVSINSMVPLDHVDAIRAGMRAQSLSRSRDVVPEQPFARLLALSHPIDMALQMSGDEAFDFVEQATVDSSAGRFRSVG